MSIKGKGKETPTTDSGYRDVTEFPARNPPTAIVVAYPFSMAEALDALFSPTLDALDLALPWN